jgi:NTP pyrophosphatase (non-canonical NTP hydrolase)
MTPNEYQKLAQRTVMPDVAQYIKIDERLNERPALSHVLVAALKLNSESGELSDALVKHICYGQPLDRNNIIEECGDLLWYIALILEKLDASMETCMYDNIVKLQKRYLEKFTEEHAAKRLDKQV